MMSLRSGNLIKLFIIVLSMVCLHNKEDLASVQESSHAGRADKSAMAAINRALRFIRTDAEGVFSNEVVIYRVASSCAARLHLNLAVDGGYVCTDGTWADHQLQ